MFVYKLFLFLTLALLMADLRAGEVLKVKGIHQEDIEIIDKVFGRNRISSLPHKIIDGGHKVLAIECEPDKRRLAIVDYGDKNKSKSNGGPENFVPYKIKNYSLEGEVDFKSSEVGVMEKIDCEELRYRALETEYGPEKLEIELGEKSGFEVKKVILKGESFEVDRKKARIHSELILPD